MMKLLVRSSRQPRRAALALLLFGLLGLLLHTCFWKEGSGHRPQHHYHLRKNGQQQQQRLCYHQSWQPFKRGQQQGRWEGYSNSYRAVPFPWTVLVAEALTSERDTQEQAVVAVSDDSGVAGHKEATSEADGAPGYGASRSVEVHAEDLQSSARINSSPREQQDSTVEKNDSVLLQQQQQTSSNGSVETRPEKGRGDTPTSTVLPVALPLSAHLETHSDATSSSSSSSSRASADLVKAQPSRLSRELDKQAATQEAADNTSGAASAESSKDSVSSASEERSLVEATTNSKSSTASSSVRDAAATTAADALGSNGVPPIAEKADEATIRGGLLWALLWPAAAFPVWVLSRMSWLLKGLAVVAAAVMQLAPLPTALRIRAQRSTGEVEGLPFLMLLFSSSLWLAYGILKLDLMLLLPNVTGVVLSCWYLRIFMRYCGRPTKNMSMEYNNNSSDDDPASRWERVVNDMQQAARGRKQRFQIYCHGAGCLLVVCGICVATAIGLARPTDLVGLTAAVVNVLTYAAPLAAVRRVLRTRSTACMPVEVSVGNWICSGLWLFYGWLNADPFIFMPNLLGTIMGLLQVALLMKYPPSLLGLDASNPSYAVDKDTEGVDSSSHLCAAAASNGACSPYVESSYLLAAAHSAAAVDVAPAGNIGAFPAVGGGAAVAGTAAKLLPATAAYVDGPELPGHSIRADTTRSLNSCCTVNPTPCHYENTHPPGSGGANGKQQAWQVAQALLGPAQLAGGGHSSNSTGYSGSTCESKRASVHETRICTPSPDYHNPVEGSSIMSECSNFGGSGGNFDSSNDRCGTTELDCVVKSSSDCISTAGTARASKDIYSIEKCARPVSGALHNDNCSKSYEPWAGNSTSDVKWSEEKVSVCGPNAPSLFTHETLLRDWQQRLQEEESESSFYTGSTAIATGRDGVNYPA